MVSTRKIVWAEGIFLGQQHFQLWERYQEAEHWRRLRCLAPDHWGVVHCEIDRDALEQGRLQLAACEVLFPDGQLLRLQQGDALPARELDELSGDATIVHLALPADRGVSGLSGYPDSGRVTAWRARYEEVSDLHDSERVREVALAEPNPHLLFGHEPRDHYVSVPVARLTSVGMGRWEPCPDFLAPACRLDAQPALHQRLANLLGLIQAKTRVLTDRWRAAGDLSRASSGQLAPYLALQVLVPALRRLEQLVASGSAHPASAALELVALEGQLAVAVNDLSDDIPPIYEHRRPGELFGWLDKRLMDLLSRIVPSQVDGLRLETEGPRTRVARRLNVAAAEAEGLYLSVRHPDGAPGWAPAFARDTRVCAREDLETVIASALPGLELRVLDEAPAGIVAAPGCRYFEIVREGEFWTRVRDQQSLALFLPTEYAEASIELVTGGG